MWQYETLYVTRCPLHLSLLGLWRLGSRRWGPGWTERTVRMSVGGRVGRFGVVGEHNAREPSVAQCMTRESLKAEWFVLCSVDSLKDDLLAPRGLALPIPPFNPLALARSIFPFKISGTARGVEGMDEAGRCGDGGGDGWVGPLAKTGYQLIQRHTALFHLYLPFLMFRVLSRLASYLC